MDWQTFLREHPDGPLGAYLSKDDQAKLSVAERLFVEGRATLDEVATILEASPDVARDVLGRSGAFKRKKILVCGGAGFIGSNFIRHILDKYPHYEVVNFDKLTYAGNLDNLTGVDRDPRYTFVQGDIADPAAIDKVFSSGVDAIINFAAETHVGRSVYYGAREFVHTNVLGVQTLLEAVKKFKTPRFLNVSTDEVYGELSLDDKRAFDETWPFQPNVPYAAAKAGGDLMCRAYWESYKTPVIVTRKGGVSTIVKDQVNGFLVRPKSSNQIAEKVNLLIENEKLRYKMGESAHRIVVERFNWDKIASKFYRLYQRMLTPQKNTAPTYILAAIKKIKKLRKTS